MAADAAKKKVVFEADDFPRMKEYFPRRREKKEKRVHFFSPNDDDDNV